MSTARSIEHVERTLLVEELRPELRAFEHRRAKLLAHQLQYLGKMIILERPIFSLFGRKEPVSGQKLIRLCRGSC